MKYLQHKKYIGFSFIIVLVLSTTSYVLIKFSKSYHHDPELPINQLIEKQLTTLQPSWSKDKEEIWDDTDYTLARWALYVNFKYKEGVGQLGEEIHVFVNPVRAKVFGYPSPGSVFSRKSYIPTEWTYRPKYADGFEIVCTDDGQYVDFTRSCTTIARYAEYTFVINAPIRDYFTYKDLEKILNTTDHYMYLFFRNSKLLPGIGDVPRSVSEIK